jgi:hypothetical protein
MPKDFCDCEDWQYLKDNYKDLFKWDTAYGWLLNWIELTEEEGYTQVHRFSINIHYCPLCGNKLKGLDDG